MGLWACGFIVLSALNGLAGLNQQPIRFRKGAGRNWNSTSGLPMRKDPTDKVGYSSASGVVRFRSGLGIESRAGAVDFRFQNLSLCQA